jgi:hypothetical protein
VRLPQNATDPRSKLCVKSWVAIRPAIRANRAFKLRSGSMPEYGRYVEARYGPGTSFTEVQAHPNAPCALFQAPTPSSILPLMSATASISASALIPQAMRLNTRHPAST